MQSIKEKISVLLRAKAGAIWVCTNEELRAKRTIAEVAAELKFRMMIWSSAKGLKDFNSDQWDGEYIANPQSVLEHMAEDNTRTIYLFLDCKQWIEDNITLARSFREEMERITGLPADEAKSTIFLDRQTAVDIPGIIPIDFPLPSKSELGKILDDILETVPEEIKEKVRQDSSRDAIITALSGLEAEVAYSAICQSICSSKTIDPLELVQSKKALLKQGGAVEWYDPEPRAFDAIGGLAVLKEWLIELRGGFTERAAQYGLPKPKGALLAGVPGTGKSLTAKAVAAAWNMPILKVGNLEGKLVGESTEITRNVFLTAKAVAPVILWMDEIEKMFAGHESDLSGSTQKVLGVFLTEIQEDTSGIFMFATSNDPTKLPGELQRRFDCLWWLDIPDLGECKAIFEVMTEKYHKALGEIDCEKLAWAAFDNQLTGAEIEKAVIAAMRAAFLDKERKVATKDVIAAIPQIVPVIRSYSNKIDALREWAKMGARKAS